MAEKGRLSRPGPGRAGVCLLLIVGAALVLRLYNLGVPSLWMDEVLVPQNASHPWPYILELTRRIEVHPPTYYVLIKGMLSLGDGDFATRLPSALAGVLGVWLSWRLGRELFGEGAGLWAAALTALNVHHLLLSRFVRPYALAGMFFALGMLAALRLSREGRPRHAALLALACAAMASLQYLSLASGFALLGWLVLDRLLWRGRTGWGSIASCAALLCAVSALEWRFFLSSSAWAGEFLEKNHGGAEALGVLWTALAANLFHDGVPWLQAFLGLAALAGLGLMWRERPREALFVSTALFGLPLALLAAGKVWNLWPRHLSPAITPLALCLGYLVCRGASRLTSPPRGAALAAGLALAGLAACLGPFHWRFYEEESYTDKVLCDGYKTMARRTLAALAPGDALVVGNDYLRNALGWYAARLPGPDLLHAQDVEPGRDVMVLRVLANMHLGGLARDRADLGRLLAPARVTPLAENVHLYEKVLPRKPWLELEPAGAFAAAPMDLLGFHERVAALKNAAYAHDSLGGFAMPTRNNVEGAAQWEFRAPPGAGSGGAALFVAYRNTGAGNHMILETAFDGEPPTLHPVSMGPDPGGGYATLLERDVPYELLRVRVRMVSEPRTPLFPGQNLETLRLEGVSAAFVPAGEEEHAHVRLRALLRERALAVHLGERFLERGLPGQRLGPLPEGLVRRTEPEYPGWTVLAPGPGQACATLTAELPAGTGHVTAYPRVGERSLVAIYQVAPDGSRLERLRLERPGEGITPVSARYPLRLDPSLTRDGTLRVEIVLQGPLAQLWVHDGTIFHAR
ncbi:hypothetical protein NNJEOMEG_02656 [Fundidesulfovibrio magnetotacticus]|uniref:Glycosyltransferase RgtA/B/C/D-like domain-containing protein n=1 Tax=Fundidesulfovibrio magnetotacticus TaxID=2730080 RepID=A0A6V8LX15_9BACT|nr:glycosyltransferase family 39 protein [Fundidesulfovibrio magnetotacticus]GFK94808.1 hypothetical protein NNJEOMEG_02656 [Fundidesulfovibrio magnetotacticus]